MIVRAGGLTLTAPDLIPDPARQAVEDLQLTTILTDAGHPNADVGETAWPLIGAVEVAAFGRRHAGRLRRCGKAARLSAHHQMVTGWGRALYERSTA